MTKSAPGRRPELWVGPEASVVRIGDQRSDQLETTGFAHRLDDLDRLAALGASRIRMPVLWERSEQAHGTLDFSWADGRMNRLRELGSMKPIVGLVHHGSGPLHTHLLDPAFACKLADYAGAVAERYPWVDAWTPVNEPLTTARFSALYGIWYPHLRSDATFVRALLNQVQATRLAMRRIRAVRPGAFLVQTEDLGRSSGTPPLASQVRFENNRRWLSLDLLCGRVDPRHPLWRYLLRAGIPEPELRDLADDPMPPDIVGINHYVTSDRFLDHRTRRYPQHLRGGNGKLLYADVEAVRVRGAAFEGFEPRLREAAVRYGLPVALTEAQLGCTREEQLRWLWEAWQAATRLSAEGIDLRAVTAWAAFGAHDWDSLLTLARGRYEPGLFDIRSGTPRPTALATLAGQLARDEPPTHPVLQSPGWWHRLERHVYRPHGPVASLPVGGTPLLIVGGHGALGQAFARLCRQRGLAYRLLARDSLDIVDADSVRAALARWSPWAVINAAGFVRVDAAERDPRQWRENAVGPVVLAKACNDAGVALLTFSSHLVFDGTRHQPYRETDPARPLNAYGRAKHHAELAVAQRPRVLVVRTAALFGPWDSNNFVAQGLDSLRRGQSWLAIGDQTVSPTYLPDLVHASLDLLIDGEQGVWHVTNAGESSWHDLACQAAEVAGLSRRDVQSIAATTAAQLALRPSYSALTSERGLITPSLDAALERYISEAGVPDDLAAPDLVFGVGATPDRPGNRAVPVLPALAAAQTKSPAYGA